MKYYIVNVKLLAFENVRLSLEIDSDSGESNCDLIIPRCQYEKYKLNVGSYFELQISD